MAAKSCELASKYVVLLKVLLVVRLIYSNVKTSTKLERKAFICDSLSRGAISFLRILPFFFWTSKFARTTHYSDASRESGFGKGYWALYCLIEPFQVKQIAVFSGLSYLLILDVPGTEYYCSEYKERIHRLLRLALTVSYFGISPCIGLYPSGVASGSPEPTVDGHGIWQVMRLFEFWDSEDVHFLFGHWIMHERIGRFRLENGYYGQWKCQDL